MSKRLNIKIVKNRYINALLILMLISAIAHMSILLFFALTSGNLYIINYFNVLDFDFFYPNIFNNFGGNVFSIVSLIVIYLIILKTNKYV